MSEPSIERVTVAPHHIAVYKEDGKLTLLRSSNSKDALLSLMGSEYAHVTGVIGILTFQEGNRFVFEASGE